MRTRARQTPSGGGREDIVGGNEYILREEIQILKGHVLLLVCNLQTPPPPFYP